MKVVHACSSEVSPPVGSVGPPHQLRCHLCTAKDIDGVIGHVARLWESRRRGSPDDWSWAEAGGYWQQTSRQLASAAINALIYKLVEHINGTRVVLNIRLTVSSSTTGG